MNKPFKIPIPNYVASSYGKSLGLKRSGARQPLHDPYEENALVVYEPPELSEHEKMKIDLNSHPVHVVIDPLLSKVTFIIISVTYTFSIAHSSYLGAKTTSA